MSWGNWTVRRLASIVIGTLGLVGFGGCSSTKIDLYNYKDVSTLSIVDEAKAGYRVALPMLDPEIWIDAKGNSEFASTMRDYFLAYNDRIKVFQRARGLGSYRIQLTLHDIGAEKVFTPPRYVERIRKIKTEKGIIVKDESYFTEPYWTHSVHSAIVAELTGPDGSKSYYDASDSFSFTQNGRYPLEITSGRYGESLQNSLENVLRQIANATAPEGLVISKKVSIKDADDVIYMVNLGHEQGMFEGRKLQLYKEIIVKNEIEAKTILNKILIGTATVSDQVSDRYAWVIPEDEDVNTKLEIGDIVRPFF